MKILKRRKITIFTALLLATSNLFTGGNQPAYNPDYTRIYPTLPPLSTVIPSAPPLLQSYNTQLTCGAAALAVLAAGGLTYSIKQAYNHRSCLLENKPCNTCKLLIIEKKYLENRINCLHKELAELVANNDTYTSYQYYLKHHEVDQLTQKLDALATPRTLARTIGLPFVSISVAATKGIKSLGHTLFIKPYTAWQSLNDMEKLGLASIPFVGAATALACYLDHKQAHKQY